MPLNPMMSNCKNTKNRERDNSFSAVYASVIASETIALERIISGLVLQVLRGVEGSPGKLRGRSG